MRSVLLYLLLISFTLPVLSQAQTDSLNKFRFIFEGSIGANVLNVNKYNKSAFYKITPVIVYTEINFCYGRPLKYNLSLDLGIGSDFDAYQGTNLMLGKYGLSLNYIGSIKHKVFIGPFLGWHNTFGFFDNPNCLVTQYNLLTAGLSLSIYNPIFKKQREKKGHSSSSLLGIKFYYQFTTNSMQFEDGNDFFSSSVTNPNLGGFFIGICGKNLDILKRRKK